MTDAAEPPPPEPRGPGPLGRLEGSSRRVVLLVGLGMAAYVVGGFVLAGLIARLSDRVGAIESERVAWVLSWLLRRTWLWAVLPWFGWAAGRFLDVSRTSFALTTALSAEAFGLLLATASDGLEGSVGSPRDAALRALTLAAGTVLVGWCVQRGRDAAAVAQAAADAEAERRKAEYAEFLARAEGRRDED